MSFTPNVTQVVMLGVILRGVLTDASEDTFSLGTDSVLIIEGLTDSDVMVEGLTDSIKV